MALVWVGRRGVRLVLFVLPALLLACAGAWAGAQAAASGAAGSLTGKLTDLHSAPLDGATVVVRNEATGAEACGVTGKNGSFRFGGLEAGVYTVEAESARLGRGRLEDVVVSAGHEARVQAAMAFEAGPNSIEPAVNVAATGNEGAVKELNPVAAPKPAAAAATVKSETAEVGNEVRDAVDPLRALALLERRAVELTYDEPKTDVEVLDESLGTEEMRGLAVRGRALPSPAPESESAIAATAPMLIASAESLPAPNLEPVANSGAISAVGVGVARVDALTADSAAATAAGMAVRAALRVIRPPVRPVLAAAERVDPGTTAGSTTMTAEQLQALPAAGRRWQDFELDAPTASTAAGGSAQISLRGADSLPAETSVDGASTRLAFGGQGAGPQSSGPGVNGEGGREQDEMAQAWAGGRGSPVAEAAIREVQTAAGNAEAEGARTAGGRVNVETARGTNGLHGQGFVFDRQNSWGAQNPFTQWVKETAPAVLGSTPTFSAEQYTPPDHETVWGVGVGSQIKRDKLFWFGALDSYDRNDPGLTTVKNPVAFFAQPSNDQAQVLAARLGLSDVNPVVEGLNAYSQMLTTLDGLLGPAQRRAVQWVGFGRLDWQAAERQRFTLEGTGAHWNSPGGWADAGF
jgi:Carboxypeptidase regulatory-like domain